MLLILAIGVQAAGVAGPLLHLLGPSWAISGASLTLLAGAGALAARTAGRRFAVLAGVVTGLVCAVIFELIAPQDWAGALVAYAVAAGSALTICLPSLPRSAQVTRLLFVGLCWPVATAADNHPWIMSASGVWLVLLLTMIAVVAPATLASTGP